MGDETRAGPAGARPRRQAMNRGCVEDPALCERRLAAWYASEHGQALQVALREALGEILADRFGYFGVQLGGGGLRPSLAALSRVRHCAVISRLPETSDIQAAPDALPLAAESTDLLLLLHVLEQTPDPHQVLREAERVLVPEGDAVIVSFNPVSMWGVWAWVSGQWADPPAAPWQGRFYGLKRSRDWLNLLGLDVVEVRRLAFLPPSRGGWFGRRLRWMERAGPRWFSPLGAVRIIVARKRRSRMILVRPEWRRAPAPTVVAVGNASRRLNDDGQGG